MEQQLVERAYDYAMEEARVEGFDFDSVEDGYIKGATDQRKIDIDNACEWLARNAFFIDAYDTMKVSININEFRKAMENGIQY